MTKAEIVNIISEGTGLTKVETQAVVDGFMATIQYALNRGERVDLRGFGSFKPVQRKARIARNPKTNAPVKVPAYRTVLFKPSKDLKTFLNEEKK